MQTVIETPTFTKQADQIWTADERLEFVDFLVANPTAGVVIPKSEGARKVRWTVKGSGKRGGVRVVYFNFDEKGIIYLVAIYQKTAKDNITGKEIKKTI